MQVRINNTATVSLDDLRDAVNEYCDKVIADIDIDESFRVYDDDLEDVDASDVIELYNELGQADQQQVLLALNIKLTDDIEFVPTTLEDKQKFEAFMENKDRFSLEKFIEMMSMKEPIERPSYEDHAMFCPHCDTMLDADDLGI